MAGAAKGRCWGTSAVGEGGRRGNRLFPRASELRGVAAPRGYDAPMAARVEELPENKVRLTVDVPAHDVQHAVEHAASDLATSREDPGLPQGEGADAGAALADRQGAAVHGGGREPHRAAGSATRSPGRGFGPIARPEYDYELPDARGRGLQLHGHRRRPAEARGRRLEGARGALRRAPTSRPRSSTSSSRRCASQSPSSSPVEAGRPRQATPSSSTSSPDGEAQRDYVVELGAGRVLEEIEEGLVGMSAGETKRGRIRARRRPEGDRRGRRSRS